MKKPKVAFICVHNSCRSQIAEALSKKGFKDSEVKGIMGENWLNFFDDAFKPEK